MAKKKSKLGKPDVNFFECRDSSVLNGGKQFPSNQQKRIFWVTKNIQERTEKSLSQFDTKHLAYQAQGGVRWKKLNKKQMEQRLKSLLSMGRSLEAFLTENLINIGNGFDHIPPFDMDQFYAIDMMSRVPFKSNGGGIRHFLHWVLLRKLQ